ncbi:hypothetical protein D3C81_1423370 [compost metagenome]
MIERFLERPFPHAQPTRCPWCLRQSRRTDRDATPGTRGAAVFHPRPAQSADRPASLAPARPWRGLRPGAHLPARRRRAQYRLACHCTHPGTTHQAVPRGARTAGVHPRRTEPETVLRLRPVLQVGVGRTGRRVHRLVGAGAQRPHRRAGVQRQRVPRDQAATQQEEPAAIVQPDRPGQSRAARRNRAERPWRRLRHRPATYPRSAAPRQPGADPLRRTGAERRRRAATGATHPAHRPDSPAAVRPARPGTTRRRSAALRRRPCAAGTGHPYRRAAPGLSRPRRSTPRTLAAPCPAPGRAAAAADHPGRTGGTIA